MRDRWLAAQPGANGRLTRYIHSCRQPAFPSGALEFCAGNGGCASPLRPAPTRPRSN